MTKIIRILSLSMFVMFSFSSAKVYAVVDGEEINDNDMMFLKQVMPNADFESLPKDMQSKAIEQAIERKLLTKEAKKDKLEDTNEYKEALESFKDTMVLELWMRKQIDTVKLSDGEIKKFYNENKQQMMVPETVEARHILVETKKEAENIIKELNKATNKIEEKFIDLAKSKSKDPSGSNGGDIGFFSKTDMVPEFANAAFALKEKTYTKQPVKTQYGYHVIYIKSKKPKGIISYEEAKPKIEQELKLVKFRELVASKAKELRKKAKVEIK